MKKLSLLLALCLMLTIVSGCSGKPAETTLPQTETTTAPPETTTAPPETTVPPTTLPDPVVIDFTLDLPEGFEPVVVQDAITVFASPNAPMDTSTITVEKLPMDESVLTMSREEFTSRFELTPPDEPTEPEETGETTEPEETADPAETTEPEETAPAGPTGYSLYSMAQMEIDGWPALYCDYTLSYAGYASHVYRFELVVNHNNYVFTFTDDTDSNVWLDSYEDCVLTIHMITDQEGIELDYSGLTHYALDCGLELYAEEGMEKHKAEGFTACLGSRNVIILLMADDKVSNNLTEMDIGDYADLLCQTNALEDFRTDGYRNLYTAFYSTDETGMEYYNVIFVKETENDFWVCQMACLADNQAEYAKPFALWASSITEG